MFEGLLIAVQWFRCHQLIQSRDLVEILREWRERAAAMVSDEQSSPGADGQHSPSGDGSD